MGGQFRHSDQEIRQVFGALTDAHLDTVVTWKMLRAACGYCSRGVRQWFDKNDMDYAAFVRDGITLRELLSTGEGAWRCLVDHIIGVDSK